MIDKKGLTSYLLITFAITYMIEVGLILSGFRMTQVPAIYGQLVIAGVMWVPALATVITIKFVTREGFGITNIRIGSWKPYVLTTIMIPVIAAVIYGITWLLGLGQPDWELTQFRSLVLSAGAKISDLPPPKLMLALIFGSSIIIGPTINGIFGFGEELGWRGYLLPKLLPLGKLKAYTISGVLWGLWHAPLILVGFNYPGYPVMGILGMCAMTTAIGFFMNEMTLKYKSSLLAGWMHGALNGQAYGIWRILFPDVNPLLGGFTGLVGILVWFFVGYLTIRRGETRDNVLHFN